MECHEAYRKNEVNLYIYWYRKYLGFITKRGKAVYIIIPIIWYSFAYYDYHLWKEYIRIFPLVYIEISGSTHKISIVCGVGEGPMWHTTGP